MRAPWRLGLVVVALAGTAVACGDDGSSDGAEVSDAGGPVATLAAAVPPDVLEEDGGDMLIYADLEGASDALGLDRPEPGDDDEIGHWFVQLAAEGPVALALPDLIGRTANEDAAWRDEVGWAPLDVDRALGAGTPPNRVDVLQGEFDADTIDEAVHAEPVWSDQLEVEDHDGTPVYVWGEEGDHDIDRVTTVRPIGQGGRMAVLDGAVVWGDTTDAVEAAVDQAAGDGDDLSGTLEDVAAALDDAGVLGAVIELNGDFAPYLPIPTGDQAGETLEPPDVTLEPYEAAASAIRLEDGEPQMVVVLQHDDGDAARTNADRLRQIVEEGLSYQGEPWSDQLEVGSIETDGATLTAVLPMTEDASPILWASAVYQRESLFTSG